MKGQVYREDGGAQWRWRLVASNGQVVAGSGEGFRSRANARRALRSLERAFKRISNPGGQEIGGLPMHIEQVE
jgi:uncharacterized protein YegP (UPF0339 family)